MDSLYRLYIISRIACVYKIAYMYHYILMPLSNKYRNINERIELEINR